MLGSYLGPPLSFWLGEIAFRLAGAFGLYALAQACIVVTYWAVFTLGRRIVGTRHAVLAVLLMVGIAAFTVPSPDFGPAILAAPLWALALLHYWRAVGEGERGYWFLLAFDLGLLLLASYVGLILLALLIVFTIANPRGRAALFHPEPWLAVLPFLIVIFPHLAWLKGARDLVVSGLNDSAAAAGTLSPGLWLCFALVVTHLGLGLMVAFAGGWPRRRNERAPLIDRSPVDQFARVFVYFFALMPAAVAIVIAFAGGRLGPLDRVAPLVVLSGLAVVVAAGDQVPIYRERIVSFTWLGLLVAPPAVIVLGIVLLPWVASVNLQDNAAGHGRGPLLCRQLPAPHRPAARLRHRRCAARAAGRARRAQPAACLFRLGAGAQSVGERRRCPRAWRLAGMAGPRQHPRAAGGPEGAVSRYGGGSAALVPAQNPGAAAVEPARLGDAAAANAVERYPQHPQSRLRAAGAQARFAVRDGGEGGIHGQEGKAHRSEGGSD